MDDDVAIGNEFVHKEVVQDAPEHKLKTWVVLKAFEVVWASRHEVVEDHDAVAALDECFGEVTADEACSAGDQVSHRARIEGIACGVRSFTNRGLQLPRSHLRRVGTSWALESDLGIGPTVSSRYKAQTRAARYAEASDKAFSTYA